MSDEKLNKNSQKALNRDQAYSKLPNKAKTYFECIAHNAEILYEAAVLNNAYEDENNLKEDYIKYIFEASKFANIGFYLGKDIEEVKRIPIKHVELGAELFYQDIHGRDDLKNLTNDEKIIRRLGRDIALYHHERWDGGGYPDGLYKEEIPVTARIVSICCEFLKLTTNKILGKPLTRDEAINQIILEAGKAYDPIIIDIFTKVSSEFVLYGESYLSYEERKALAKEEKIPKEEAKVEALEPKEEPKALEVKLDEPSPPPIKEVKPKRKRLTGKMSRHLKLERPIYLTYSPILNTKTNEIDFYRATLIVNARYYGAIRPEVYEGIAKRNNLSLKLLEIELDEIFELFLIRKHLELPIKPVSIRLNDYLLEKKAIYNKLIDFLKKNEIETNKIIFEIPENVLLLKNQKIKETIKKLRQSGFKLAIYDFNLDYLTLQRLLKFKFNYLLVDKKYITNLDINPSIQGLAESILEISVAVGADALCQGADSEYLLDVIKKTGYKFIEGTSVGKPQKIKEIIRS